MGVCFGGGGGGGGGRGGDFFDLKTKHYVKLFFLKIKGGDLDLDGGGFFWGGGWGGGGGVNRVKSLCRGAKERGFWFGCRDEII